MLPLVARRVEKEGLFPILTLAQAERGSKLRGGGVP